MSIETPALPEFFKPIGPYSHIAKSGPFIMCSGTPGIDPASGELNGADAYSQTKQILCNFKVMLQSVAASLDDVMHIHVFLKRVEDFEQMNKAYSEIFTKHLPARTVICVADLPKKDALLTMNLTAYIKV
jgi:2-iminobutanoate/2-iminopropanoate deaminase